MKRSSRRVAGSASIAQLLRFCTAVQLLGRPAKAYFTTSVLVYVLLAHSVALCKNLNRLKTGGGFTQFNP